MAGGMPETERRKELLPSSATVGDACGAVSSSINRRTVPGYGLNAFRAPHCQPMLEPIEVKSRSWRGTLFAGLCLVAGCSNAAQDPAAVRASCDGGHAPSCHTLALWLETGFFDVVPDRQEARALYEKACELGRGVSCFARGQMHLVDDSTSTGYVLAGALYERGCGLGDMASCDGLARMLENGLGMTADPDSALVLYQVACEAASLGCMRVQALEAEGEDEAPREVRHSTYTQAPQILNRAETLAAVEREYPPALRAAGETATVMILFFIDEQGRNLERRIDVSSGNADFDAAALRVAEVFEFRPAYTRFTPGEVWISLPVTFQTERCSNYYYHKLC